MKTILLSVLGGIIVFLVPTVSLAQISDHGIVYASIATNPVSEGINVYPNPTHGNIMLQFYSVKAGTISLNIMDITGKLVFTDSIVATEGINLHEIDLSKELKGIYMLTLKNAGFKEQKRFIVE